MILLRASKQVEVVVRLILQKEGFHVDQRSSLSALTKEKFNLVVVEDGWFASSTTAVRSRHQAIPVLCLTSADPFRRSTIKGSECTLLLPFDPKEFIDAVQKICSREQIAAMPTSEMRVVSKDSI